MRQTRGDKPTTAQERVLSNYLPSPFSRFAGFAFLQCWTLVCFSSNLLLAESESSPLPMPQLFMFASLVSILTALAVLLLSTRIMPLSRHMKSSMAAAFVGMVGTLVILLCSQGDMPTVWAYLAYAFVAFGNTWLTLSWQEYLAAQGARRALVGLALTTLMAVLLFLILCLLPQAVTSVISVALPIAAALTLDPRRGTLFFSNIEHPLTVRQLCSVVAHDFSPKVMTTCALCGMAYSAIRTITVSETATTASSTWLQASVGLSFGVLVACAALLSTRRHGLARSMYVAIPLVALGVLMATPQFGAYPLLALVLCSCGYYTAIYLVWTFMMESAAKKKLPVLGLFASLWSACFTGQLAGQAVALTMSANFTALSYLLLLALIAAALLTSGSIERLSVSKSTMDAPDDTPRTRRIIMLAEQADLSPRETEILTIWLSGHNAEYLEQVLHISRNTIKTHLNHIYQKTGCSGREELLQRVDQP